MIAFELTLNAQPGALARLVTLFTSRRWPVAWLDYPPAQHADRRLMVVGLEVGDRGDQVEAQLAKLYDVLAVRRIPEV